MRILLINPNTTESVTALVADQAGAIAGDAATFVPVTGRFGARYISTRAAAAIAAHAALDVLAEHVAGCDAVYLACFGDPGLAALREISPVPVIGMAEASCLEACKRGRRFLQAVELLHERAELLQARPELVHGDQCREVVTLRRRSVVPAHHGG